MVIKFIDLIINIFFLESLYDMCIFFECENINFDLFLRLFFRFIRLLVTFVGF